MERALELVAPVVSGYPRRPELLPAAHFESGRWRARFARTPNELDAILRLRFEVFNLELGEGLESSQATRRDEDRFDAFCHHLLVEEKTSGAIVGTYRMQTWEMARDGCGFYSAGEFDLARMPAEVLGDSIEVGRACIHRDHRHKQVLFLLWRGLAAYVQATGKRFLFGCSSLTSQDPAEGLRLYRQLRDAGSVHSVLDVPPLPALRCTVEHGGSQRGSRDTAEVVEGDPPVHVPTLFRTYLRYGAQVVSAPALDREFKTIDYLVLIDVAGLSPRTRQVFFGGQEPLGARDHSADPASG
jgi:putative hemolysin